ncbi:MAG: YitT family protein [Oscillospiraceae bacterium]
MLNSTMRTSHGRLILAAFGVLLMSAGINIFTTPLNLYTSGLMGYAQLIRTVLDQYLGIRVTFIDLAGVLYYLINVPILILTTRSLGKGFALKTILYTSLFSVATAVIPVPKVPLVEDTLTSVLLGAICMGVGDGLVLTCGCSVGGLDMLGLYFSKKTGTPVGQFGTYANVALYVACFFLFDFSVVVYSVIYMVFSNMIVDKMHQQNINLQVFIFTKDREGTIQRQIMEETGRGVTCWDGAGAYTSEPTRILCTCINRYEREQIERIVKEADPKAFLIAIPGVYINGNFIHKV